MPDEFAAWLRSSLDRAGISQSELARRIGTNPSVVSAWLHGKAKAQTRMRERVEGVLGAPRVSGVLQAAYRRRGEIKADIARLEAELDVMRYEMQLLGSRA